MKSLPNPGTYQGGLAAQIVLYESEKTGAFCAAIPCTLLDSEVKWNGRYTCTLVNKDGVASDKNFKLMKEVFGFDHTAPSKPRSA